MNEETKLKFKKEMENILQIAFGQIKRTVDERFSRLGMPEEKRLEAAVLIVFASTLGWVQGVLGPRKGRALIRQAVQRFVDEIKPN